METNLESPSKVREKLSWMSFGANVAGGMITFFYLSVVDPLPSGEESVRSLEQSDFASFVITVTIITIFMFWLGSRLQRPIWIWQERINAGRPSSDIPQHVSTRILNWPLINTVITAAAWLFAALFFAYFYDNPNNFIGITIGGVVTTSIVYFGTDLLWRRLIPFFFPSGNVSAIPAFHLSVRRRLMLSFILVGLITPVLLVILSIDRARTLLSANNPQAVWNNLIIVLLFVLISGLVTAVIVAVLVARAIVEPIQTLREGMDQVQKNNLDTRVLVVTNDELGFLSERFNQMTHGLRQGAKLRQLFGLYVSPAVARAAVETGAGLGGELVYCTVMFSDIRDFTTLTEELPPKKLVKLINQYMAAMVSVITKSGGMVTRFGGDSILAVFGTPLNPMPDHEDQALMAGLEMRQALQDFNQSEPLSSGYQLENGIGIASGQVIAGNVGGEERIEYTVMGDAANLAARLEELTKDVGYPILLSAETFQAIGIPPLAEITPLTDIQIKGKRHKVTVYGISD